MKLRFSLFNKNHEELLTIAPSVNWQKLSHDFQLYVTEGFKKNVMFILQAVPCADCSISMIKVGSVPALLSV